MKSATLTFGNGFTTPYAGLREDRRREQEVVVSVRPEEFTIATDGHGVDGTIVSSVFLGLNTTYFVKLFDGSMVEIIEESSIDNILENGTHVSLGLKLSKVNVFNAEGDENLTAGVVNDAN